MLIKSNPNKLQLPAVITDFFDIEKFSCPRWLIKEFEPTVLAVSIKKNGREYNLELVATDLDPGNIEVSVEKNKLTISTRKGN